MSRPDPRRRAKDPRRLRTCTQCLAWGVLWRPTCSTCCDFSRRYPAGICSTCRREVPVRDGVCRLCRKQATLISKVDGHAHRKVDLTVAARTGHQLFFANVGHFRGKGTTRQPKVTPQAAVETPPRVIVADPGRRPGVQLMLCDPLRDYRGTSPQTPPRDPALMALLLHHTETLAERYGWQKFTVRNVRYVLNGLAGCHEPGETIKASTVQALTELKVPTRRVLEVLSMVDGLLVDDRPDALTRHIDAQFAELPTPMRQELQVWIDTLRHGGPRRRAHPEMTTRTRLLCARPFLLEVATRYQTLRQVTGDDVSTWLECCRRPEDTLGALRDLFRVLKTQRLVFTNPTSRIHHARRHKHIPRPLSPQVLQQIGHVAQDNPVLRVVVVLIGVHALSPKQVCGLQLDDIDLPNRRLHLNGTERSLDPFSADAINDYSSYRHHRWPHTSNPHLLVTSISANDHSTVSAPWLCNLFRDLPATPNQLRQDRILEEARATGADPLHLAAMFDFAADTGLRYASAVTPEPAPPGL
jgi:hypothetical protein